MLPAGILRERVVIETPTETRNALGESVQVWSDYAERFASIDQIAFSEIQTRGQLSGNASFRVRMRFLPGLTSSMRLRWTSRENRTLYISEILEQGHRQEHELTVEEQTP
jgi:head-tail adaptor